MAEHVVGDWKDFTFQIAEKKDIEKVAQHLRDNFLKDETMHNFLGWSEENAEDHDRLVSCVCVIPLGLTLVAFKKNTEEVVGVNLILAGNGCMDYLGIKCRPTSWIFKTVYGLITKVEEKSKDTSPNYCGNYADIFITSVDARFRRQGVASEMYRRTLEFLRAKSFESVRAGFTGPGTQAIGVKLGFKELGRIYYKGFKSDKGEILFPRATDFQFCIDMVKRFDSELIE